MARPMPDPMPDASNSPSPMMGGGDAFLGGGEIPAAGPPPASPGATLGGGAMAGHTPFNATYSPRKGPAAPVRGGIHHGHKRRR